MKQTAIGNTNIHDLFVKAKKGNNLWLRVHYKNGRPTLLLAPGELVDSIVWDSLIQYREFTSTKGWTARHDLPFDEIQKVEVESQTVGS